MDTIGNRSSEFERIFARLRGILIKHARSLAVTEHSSKRYCLEGRIGSATLQAWSGKMKRPSIPVGWVQIGKGYVSFHLMGIDASSKARAGMSKALQARMQGKTCFNFKISDEVLFQELEQLTASACEAFKKAGFIE